MLRDSDDLARRVEKLLKINVALMQRLERVEETRGPAYALTRTAAMLEREVVARNRDLEQALAELAAINTELASAREVADEANRAKTRFLRAASHDLLQPLSAAKLFLSHLSEMATEPLHKALVSHLTATIDSAEELIRALSNIAKLDSQSFQMNRSAVAMGRLFRRLIIDMQPLATSRGIDLRFVASGATVDSDPVFLRQIAQNLIANALKYTTGKKVLVGIRQAGDAVWLEVLDAGPGIHAKDQDRIFNEFERLSRSDEPGTGLGLSIVRRACQQLGHGLDLRSAYGKGSRFRVRLPRWTEVPERRTEGKGRRRESRESDAVFVGRKVLVVENDPGMRQAFAYLLGGWGMEPAVVGGIAAARKAVARQVPDIILSDYRLDRDETGIEAIDTLRRDLGRKIPAVLISVEADEAMRQEAQALRVEVLAKPVVETDLKSALRQALRGRA